MATAGKLPPKTLKVVIAGPKCCGKSTIANFLAGQADKLQSEKYEPTVGVRILEFESRSVNGTSVELWDASGDSS